MSPKRNKISNLKIISTLKFGFVFGIVFLLAYGFLPKFENFSSKIQTAYAAVTLSGTAYESEGGLALTNKTLKAYKNGTTLLEATTTDTTTGAWSVIGDFVSGDVITLYIDGDTVKANTILITDGTAKTDINLFGGTLVVRQDAGASISNAHLHIGAVAGEDDMVYATSTGNAIILNKNIELHIYTGDNYWADAR